MVHDDQIKSGSGEPPQLGDSWWKAALSEGEEDLSVVFNQDDSDGSLDRIPSLILLAQPENDWNYVDRLYQSDEIIQLKVVGCNQGGLLVQGDTINGFVPSSHLLAGHKKNEYLQQIVSLKIIEYDKIAAGLSFQNELPRRKRVPDSNC